MLAMLERPTTLNPNAITCDLGTITAGQLRNAGNTAGVLLSGSLPGTWTSYLRLTATGSQAFLQHPSLSLRANGSATFTGIVETDTQLQAPTIVVGANLVLSFSGGIGGMSVGGGQQLVIGAGNHAVILDGSTQGFYGATGISKPTITGSRSGGAALTNLLAHLDNMGLFTDSTTP